ncbi:MAG: hypothetical protein A3J76_02495 [Candidatus Moranbacteria bacterium RBG_13_45_13]|nr:MAG: hypothetical protein A3J76_02495 [Candidatus Moranbacteria bacterium RBG_13_45_13]
MPSPNFADNSSKNNESALKTALGSDFSYPSQAENFRRRRDENYNYAATKPYRQQPSEEKTASAKDYQNKLKRLQGSSVGKKLTNLAKEAKKSPTGAALSLGLGLFRQINLLIDWPIIFILIPFAFLKDIVDIVFAALTAATSWIPILGTGAAGAGIIFSFVLNILLQILAVVCLVLIGADLKNRGLAKYFMVQMIEFVAESFPGIDWLPWAVIFAVVLYFCVLLDRYLAKQEQKALARGAPAAQPAPA